MIKFIALITIASLIGVQFGLYVILRQKNISPRRSFLFTFGIYPLPYLIVGAHVELYKKRHLLMQSMLEKGKINKVEFESDIDVLDSKRFLLYFIYMTIKDVLTPKDNIMLLIGVAEIYTKKYKYKQTNLMERIGAIGIVKKATGLIRGDLVSHASKQIFTDNKGIKEKLA